MPGKCKKAICSYNFPNLLCSKFYPSVCYLFSRFTWLENRVSQKRLQILGLTASNLQTFFSTPCFPASWTWKTSNSHMEKFSALQIWKIIGTKYYFSSCPWFIHPCWSLVILVCCKLRNSLLLVIYKANCSTLPNFQSFAPLSLFGNKKSSLPFSLPISRGSALPLFAPKKFRQIVSRKH